MTLWLLAQAAAITLVFCLGDLFKPIRSRGPKLWQEFASCPLCVGVWVGGGMQALVHAPTSLQPALQVLGIGCITGVAALTVKRTLDALEAQADP